MISLQIFLVFSLSIILIRLYASVRFKNTEIFKVSIWHQFFILALGINITCFFLLSMYFYNRYGFMTDDANYFYGAEKFNKSFFQLNDGTEFMLYIVKPLKRIFNLDLPSFHIIFSAMGFIGSLNYLYVLTLRNDFIDKTNYKVNRIAFFVMLCFPNFMAWGRIFGKDSTIFFLASIFLVGAIRILKENKINIFSISVLIGSLYIMQIIRPHIAGIIATSFFIAYILKLWKYKSYANVGRAGILKLYIPLALLFISLIFIFNIIRKLNIDDSSVTVESVKQTIIHTSKMGAYGGSATELASEIDENPDIIFKPFQIFKNIIRLLFDPLPWKIRGGADLIALLSNIIFIYLVVRFRKNISLFDIIQKYLFFTTVGLVLLLSFMTGNVGLILRQKTIILPFFFLMLFSNPYLHENKTA
jgi:hypothetical protein